MNFSEKKVIWIFFCAVLLESRFPKYYKVDKQVMEGISWNPRG